MFCTLITGIEQAQALTRAGFHRRAMQLRCDIAAHPNASAARRDLAWRQIAEMQAGDAQMQKAAARKKHEEIEEKKSRLERDRLRIFELFAKGYTPVQVRSLTGRSRSFVDECRKKQRRS
ncbi:hypothetical protein [Sodalis sp. RH22]|uniref:hypothetical protein n=1 Tax=unclassified Sodalis (in: enterobacteria) TaxID=2636512 RepID=UPI0039B5B094